MHSHFSPLPVTEEAKPETPEPAALVPDSDILSAPPMYDSKFNSDW
jgi:hypothetical protein